MKKQFSFLAAMLIATGAPLLADNPAPASVPDKKAGKLLEKQGCLHCHFVSGDGGFIGPPLDGIGKHRSREFIEALLTGSIPEPDLPPLPYPDPKKLMDHMKLSHSDAATIATYLMSLPELKTPIKIKGHSGEGESLPEGFSFKPAQPNESSNAGLKAYRDSGCAACHSIGGRGGRLGPNLDGIGAYRSRAYIENRIKNGAIVMFGADQYHPSSYTMPPLNLPDETISRITDFLLTLPEKK
ncbi:MAG: c-type cytochrome [Candidatus Obscuribacterales bacterium]